MKQKLTFKPITGLDVAKLLGQEAVDDYNNSQEKQFEQQRRMKKNLEETFDMFKRMNR